MSGKEFFVKRYEKLGWQFQETEPKQAIRINTMNVEEEALVERLESHEIELEKIPFLKHGYWISKAKFSAGATSEYLLGLYSIQEAAAQIPATLFTEAKNKTLLDACAAPGGKTVQLADLMSNTGAIIALDIEKRRLIALSNHLERCNIKNTIVYNMDVRSVSQLKITFNKILLDVPCSGNFTTDKDWFRRRTIKDVERNARLQREILTEATKVLKDDGEMVYSTCSLEPEENEMNIDWAINSLDLQVEKIDCYGENALSTIFGKKLDSSVENCRRIWPGKTQGFFVCKLKKRGDAR
ncbi:MAG TPA: RsmB/NOP family class I SAM-dependent RNA methyltransferase [Candidatus Bathyarchaeia archaeon]